MEAAQRRTAGKVHTPDILSILGRPSAPLAFAPGQKIAVPMSGAMVLAFGVLPCHVPVVSDLPRGGTLSRGGLSKTNSRSCSETHVHRAVSEMVGASEETGGVFDPLGLATDEVRENQYQRVRGCLVCGCVWVGCGRGSTHADVCLPFVCPPQQHVGKGVKVQQRRRVDLFSRPLTAGRLLATAM